MAVFLYNTASLGMGSTVLRRNSMAGMEKDNGIGELPIDAACERLICRVCCTKVGWRHQRWCTLRQGAALSCRDCYYWDADKAACRHPSQRKNGDGI